MREVRVVYNKNRIPVLFPSFVPFPLAFIFGRCSLFLRARQLVLVPMNSVFITVSYHCTYEVNTQTLDILDMVVLSSSSSSASSSTSSLTEASCSESLATVPGRDPDRHGNFMEQIELDVDFNEADAEFLIQNCNCEFPNRRSGQSQFRELIS